MVIPYLSLQPISRLRVAKGIKGAEAHTSSRHNQRSDPHTSVYPSKSRKLRSYSLSSLGKTYFIMPSTASSITSYLTFFLLLSLVSAQLKTCPIKSPTLLFSKCLNYEALKAYTGTWFQVSNYFLSTEKPTNLLHSITNDQGDSPL